MLSHVRPSPRRIEPSFRLGEAPTVLAEIHREGVNVAVWERPPLDGLAEVLGGWAAAGVVPFDGVVSSSGYSLWPLFAGLPPGAARERLASDVAMLLGHFVAVSRAPRFQLFFGAIGDDQCPKFHVDYICLRMIATYVGPGTEWLPDSVVRREAMENSPECPDLANAAVVRDPASVRHAQPGHVVMLKGARYDGSKARAAVHRSPPLESFTGKRVVLIATARPL